MSTESSRLPDGWKKVPGTDIEEIRALNPDWAEEQCRKSQRDAIDACLNEMISKKNARKRKK